MFFGTSDHSLDDKNRLIIPKRFLEVIRERSEAGNPFMLTAGYEHNLLLLSQQVFTSLVADLGNRVVAGLQTRLKRRLMLGHAEQLKVDSAGRVVINDALRRYAEIGSKDLVLAGCGDAIEIWSRDRWADATTVPEGLFDTEQMVESAAPVGV